MMGFNNKLKYFLVMLLMVLLLHVFWFLKVGFTNFEGHADVALVMGTTVHENGEPSKRLKARCDAAIMLFKNK